MASQDPAFSLVAQTVKTAGGIVTGRTDLLEETVSQAPNLDCHVLVLNAYLPGSVSVQDAVWQIRTARPDLRVILLLDEDTKDLTKEVMKAQVYDWVIGELPGDLAERLLEPHTFADVVRAQPGRATAPALPQASAPSAFGETFEVALGLPQGHQDAFAKAFTAWYPGRIQVGVRAGAFEDLLTSLSGNEQGIVLSSALPSRGDFDLPTKVKLLAGVSQATVLLLVEEAPTGEFQETLAKSGVLVMAGHRTEGGKLSYDLAELGKFVSRMDTKAKAKAKDPDPALSAPATTRRFIPRLGGRTRAAEGTPGERARPEGPDALSKEPPSQSVVYKPLRTVSVTSFSGGTGKSTVAVNLAALAAQGGMKVGLLSLDPMNTTAADFFAQADGEARPLSQLRGAEAEGEEISRRFILDLGYETKIGKGSVTVFKVRAHGATPESLSGALTRRVVEVLRSEFQFLVLDTHPLLSLAATYEAILHSADLVYLVTTDTRDTLAYAVEGYDLLRKLFARAGQDSSESDIRLIVNRKSAGGYPEEHLRKDLPLPVAAVIPDGGDAFKQAMRQRKAVSLAERDWGVWHRLLTDALGEEALPEALRPAAKGKKARKPASDAAPLEAARAGGGLLTRIFGGRA